MAPSSGQARAATSRDPQHAVFSFVEQSQEGSLAMIGPYCVACMNILHIGGRFAAAPPAIFIHTSDGGRQLTMDDLVLTNGSLTPFSCRGGTADKKYLLLDCVRATCKTVAKVNTRDVGTEARISEQPAVRELSNVISTQFARTLTTREGYAQTNAPKLSMSDVKTIHCMNRLNKMEAGTQTIALKRSTSSTQDQSSQAQLSEENVDTQPNGDDMLDFLTASQLNTLKRIAAKPELQPSLNNYFEMVERRVTRLARRGEDKQPNPVSACLPVFTKKSANSAGVADVAQKLADPQSSSSPAEVSDRKPVTSPPLLHGNKSGVALTDDELEANLCRLDEFMSCFTDTTKEELLRLTEERNWLSNDCRVCEKITDSYLDHVVSGDHLQKLKAAGYMVTSSDFSELEMLLLTCMKKVDGLTARQLERFTRKNVPFLLGTLDESKKVEDTELFFTIEKLRNGLALCDASVVAKLSIMQFHKQSCRTCEYTCFTDIVYHVISDDHIEKIAGAKRFFSRWDVMTMTAFLRDVKRGCHATKGKTSDRGRWFHSAVIVEPPQSAPDLVLSATSPSSTSTALPTKLSSLDPSSYGPSANAAVSDTVRPFPPQPSASNSSFTKPSVIPVAHSSSPRQPSQILSRLFQVAAGHVTGKRLTVFGIEEVIHHFRLVFTDAMCAELCRFGGHIRVPKNCSLGCPAVRKFRCFCAALKHFLSDSHISCLHKHLSCGIEADFLFFVDQLDSLVVRSKRTVPGWHIDTVRGMITRNSIGSDGSSMNAASSRPAQTVPTQLTSTSSSTAKPSVSTGATLANSHFAPHKANSATVESSSTATAPPSTSILSPIKFEDGSDLDNLNDRIATVKTPSQSWITAPVMRMPSGERILAHSPLMSMDPPLLSRLFQEEVGVQQTMCGTRLEAAGILNVMFSVHQVFTDSVCTQLCAYAAQFGLPRWCWLGCREDGQFLCFCAALKHLLSSDHLELLQKHESCTFESDYLFLLDTLDDLVKTSKVSVTGWNRETFRRRILRLVAINDST